MTASSTSQKFSSDNDSSVLEARRAERRARYDRLKDQENAYSRAYYARNREHLKAQMRANKAKHIVELREYSRQWLIKDRIRNRVSYLFRSAKGRAKKWGLEFTMTTADLTVPEACPVLGIPIVIETGPVRDGAPSIDRIDNTLGYIPGNVRIISFRANAIKRDMTLAEAELLVRNWNAR